MAAVTFKHLQIFRGGGCGVQIFNCPLEKDICSHERQEIHEDPQILVTHDEEKMEKMVAVKHLQIFRGGCGVQIFNCPLKKDLCSHERQKIHEDPQILKREKEAELKRKRSEEREAARKKLEMVEQNADVEDSFQVMRELEELMGGGSTWADLGLCLVEEDEEDDDWINSIPIKMVTTRNPTSMKNTTMRGIPWIMGTGFGIMGTGFGKASGPRYSSTVPSSI